MEPTFFAQYKGFEFYCSPRRLHGGGFAPRLLVSADFSAGGIDIPVPVQGPAFVNATAAAHLSFRQGRRWVDTGEGGLPPSVRPLPYEPAAEEG